MGWSVGYVNGRDVGYGVPATCDHPGCGKRIDRGVSYACGGEHGGNDHGGCGLYFCGDHRDAEGLCERCAAMRLPFDPTPDLASWTLHKLTHPSWARWRAENNVAELTMPPTHKGFHVGDRVRKRSGSAWSGTVVGWYSTTLTPEGYAVESDAHPGSVQIYPAAALEIIEA